MAALPAAHRQATIVVPDAPSCLRCSIELAKNVTLGKAGDSISPDAYATVARTSAGRYIVAPIDVPGTIALYDERGTLTGTLGRFGQGPGEHRDISIVKVDRADTLFVYDPGNSRITVYGPDLRLVRTVRLPLGAVVDFAPLSSGEIAFSAASRAPDMIGLPFHVVNTAGVRTRSFGSTDAAVGPRDVPERRRITPGADGYLLASVESRYELERWTLDGAHVLTVQRRAEWFPPRPNGARESALVTRPVPVVTGAWEAPDGLIWVRIDVAAPNWKPQWKPGDPEPSTTTAQHNALVDTMLEVIDPRAGRVVAAKRVDIPLRRFFGPGMTYTQRQDADGYRSVDVWSFRLIRPSSMALPLTRRPRDAGKA